MLRLERWVKEPPGGRERGNAMIIVLIVFTLGMLVVTPVLSHMATGSEAAAIYRQDTRELYAADAGIEYAIWRLRSGMTVEPSITVGGIPVAITVSQLTELPYGPVLADTGPQSWRLEVLTSLINNGDNIYTGTVTIRNVGPSTIHLSEVGSGMPEGFIYVTGSTSGDLTTADPSSISGAKLTWELDGNLSLNSLQTKTHTFRIQGNSYPEGYYSWVKAKVSSIGIISGCSGYNVTSQANGGTTITANVAGNLGYIFPVSWQVNE